MYTSRCRPGFTLIELIVFIVIVSVGLAGVLTVFNTVTRSSAEPVRDKQALAAAEAMLEEALNNNFANPGGGYTPAGCPATASCDRARFDDVDDYNNYGSNSAGTLCAGADIGIKDLTTAATVVLPGYDLTVVVAVPGASFAVGADSVTVANYRVVTVSVTDCLTGNDYSLTGYKFNND